MGEPDTRDIQYVRNNDNLYADVLTTLNNTPEKYTYEIRRYGPIDKGGYTLNELLRLNNKRIKKKTIKKVTSIVTHILETDTSKKTNTKKEKYLKSIVSEGYKPLLESNIISYLTIIRYVLKTLKQKQTLTEVDNIIYNVYRNLEDKQIIEFRVSLSEHKNEIEKVVRKGLKQYIKRNKKVKRAHYLQLLPLNPDIDTSNTNIRKEKNKYVKIVGDGNYRRMKTSIDGMSMTKKSITGA